MNSEVDAFFLSRRLRWASWYGVLFLPVAVAWYAYWAWMEHAGSGIGIPWLLYALSALSHGVLLVCFAWGLFHQSRPVIRVSDREVDWGSPFYFTGNRRRIPIDEIRSVGWRSPKRLRLETRSRGPVDVNLKWIAKDQREEVYDAVARRIHAP